MRGARVAVLLALGTGLAVLFGVNGTACAKVQGSAHDFRGPGNGGPNTRFPNLAKLAGTDPCGVCHKSHQAAKSVALFGEDFEWAPTSNRISLPSSTLCMSCHNGEAKFGDGPADIMADQAKVISKRHRRHRVEFFYPAAADGVATPGKIGTDAKGRPAVIGPNGLALPLYLDSATGRLKGGCGTCHDPHAPGSEQYYLRTKTMKELCRVCHGTPSGATSAWAPVSAWPSGVGKAVPEAAVSH